MTNFTLDTSGVVSVPNADPYGPTYIVYTWSSLTLFAQGYVEAQLRSLVRVFQSSAADESGRFERWSYEIPVLNRTGGGYANEAAAWEAASKHLRFDMFHHDALAMILRDCEAYQRERDERGPYPASYWTAEKGADFWGSRQGSVWINFPPLTAYLDDAGKVCLKVRV